MFAWVLHFVSSGDDIRFFVSYINLNSYRGDAVAMEVDGNTDRATAAALHGHVALKAADPFKCVGTWDMAACLPPAHDWALELFIVSGSGDSICTELDISCVECRL